MTTQHAAKPAVAPPDASRRAAPRPIHVAAPPGVRVGRDGTWRLWTTPGLDVADVRRVLPLLPTPPGRHYLRRDIAGAPAFVKVYNRRAKHGVLRRLRPGRSVNEARGYLAFARAGLETPRVLFWGEERALGLWRRGVICTEFIDSPTVAESFARDRDESLLLAAADALGRIHRAGLAHGDPRTRNFLATSAGALPFDLCSWGPLTRRAREWDLVQFLGSAAALGADESLVRRMLGACARESGRAGDDAVAILSRAGDYARREGEP